MPVTEGMCTMGELKRGDLTLLDVRRMHDAVAVKAENMRRGNTR